VLVGAGRSFDKLAFHHHKEGEIQIEFADYIDKVMEQNMERLKNPIMFLKMMFTTAAITPMDRLFAKNSKILRDYLREIIKDRMNGVTDGLAVEGNKDIISMLLEDEIYKDDIDDIIDDIIVMFIAGSKTVQGTTTNFLGHYCSNEKLRKDFHAEVDPIIEQCKDDFVNKFTFEMTEDLVYVKNAYNEVMRIDTPFSVGSPATVMKDAFVDGISFKKEDPFMIMMEFVHSDPAEWIEPEKFIPERFDSNSPYFMRPDGKKRTPLSFIPFLAG
jgi:cytochrome P450